jgi:hypothetical protein
MLDAGAPAHRELAMRLLFRVIPALLIGFALASQHSAQAKSKKGRSVPAIWKVTETGARTATASWTWSKKKKRFLGRWSDGAVGYLYVRKGPNRITLSRYDPRGPTAGLRARYEGTLSGDTYEGSVEYTWNGQVTRGSWKAVRAGKTGATVGRRPLNKRRYPSQRRILYSPGERRSFPYLGTKFEVLAPRTKVYNCIAWSVGIRNRWVWPGVTISAFDQLYGSHGFRRVRTGRLSKSDYRPVPGIQKIVLYAIVYKNGKVKCTHGARQLPDGTWTSKLGKLPLIRHLTPQALNGPSYGRPIAVYVKS